MSGELTPKPVFTVGQEVTALWRGGRAEEHAPRKARVVHVGRVWAEAEVENWSRLIRFRMDNGMGDPDSQFHIEVPEIIEYQKRVNAAWSVLTAHRFTVDHWHRNQVNDAELFAVAELLDKGV